MLLNKKQACGYLKDGNNKPMKPENFTALVNSGQIGFKTVGKSKRYPIEELDRWLKELTYIRSTNEAKRGGRISQFRRKTDVIGIDALAEQKIKSKLNYFAKNK